MYYLLDDFFRKAASIQSLTELYAATEFVHPYFGMKMSYDLPKVCHFKSKEVIESHYEDFLAY